MALSIWIQRRPVSHLLIPSTFSGTERVVHVIPTNIEPIPMEAADIVRNFDRNTKRLVWECLQRKILVCCLTNERNFSQKLPSVISTWFLKHATHIFAGFGSINVPHSQHNLKFGWFWFIKSTIQNITQFPAIISWISFLSNNRIKLTFLRLSGYFLVLNEYPTQCTPWLDKLSRKQFENWKKNGYWIKMFHAFVLFNTCFRKGAIQHVNCQCPMCLFLYEAMVGAIFFQLLKCQNSCALSESKFTISNEIKFIDNLQYGCVAV